MKEIRKKKVREPEKESEERWEGERETDLL